MSFYNMIHGVNPLSGVLLKMLDTTTGAIPRFRDCYFDGEHIVIYTRTGGGNRDFYESEQSCRANYPENFTGTDDPSGPWNEDLRCLPGFVRDADDDYDCTYASFFFAVPEQFNLLLDKLRSMAQKETQSERWEAALDRIKTATPGDPLVARMTEAFAPVFKEIERHTTDPKVQHLPADDTEGGAA
jgi:hypothetical protein